MPAAVIVDCVRTPIGWAHGQRGWFRDVRSDELAVACVRALIERTGIDPSEIEDVVMGCSRQCREQGVNVARSIALMAGLPVETGATTVNRLCGSSLQALNQAVHAVMAGCQEVQIVGGLEHMQRVPAEHEGDIHPKLFRRISPDVFRMGLTAEYLARSHGITRREQDVVALESHRRAAAAQANGLFQREMVPVCGRDEQGRRFRVQVDQCVRPETSLDLLAKLAPAFLAQGGTVTAGNSCPINDGAAALLLMSEAKAAALGLQPLVRIRSTAVAGVEPAAMGTGPVAASTKALRRAGLKMSDINLTELNEAFASQVLYCARTLNLDWQRVNVRGGAIAIGHPLGASGARIATTLIHAMVDRDATFGLATMCIGLGQGIATVLERV
jgi:acetyl-CoA acyltransferase